jgi:hypothetical protein
MPITYRVHMYLNESAHMFITWEPGDALRRSDYSLDIVAESPEEAADAMFAAFNRDDRPNGQVEHSLSVGDVLLLVPQEQAFPSILLCASAGWTTITREQVSEHHAMGGGVE